MKFRIETTENIALHSIERKLNDILNNCSVTPFLTESELSVDLPEFEESEDFSLISDVEIVSKTTYITLTQNQQYALIAYMSKYGFINNVSITPMINE